MLNVFAICSVTLINLFIGIKDKTGTFTEDEKAELQKSFTALYVVWLITGTMSLVRWVNS